MGKYERYPIEHPRNMDINKLSMLKVLRRCFPEGHCMFPCVSFQFQWSALIVITALLST